MQQPAHFITLREGSQAKALIAAELGAWLLGYARHLPGRGYVEALHFSQEVVDRYPNQMYAGNPLLFPLVSFNHTGGNEHHYQWQGKLYAMPQHGFARRLKWKTAAVSESSVLLELTDTAETLKNYPFRFLCQVRYELKNGTLRFQQRIENLSNEVMPFSAGIHPYFNVPLSQAGSRDECYVEFPAARMIKAHHDWQNWTAETFSERRIPVSQDASGTIFLTDLAEPKISLVDPKSRLRITVDLSGAPAHRFIALWSKSTSDPFYCIEPWTALPNSFARPKTESILLAAGQVFTAEIGISVEET